MLYKHNFFLLQKIIIGNQKPLLSMADSYRTVFTTTMNVCKLLNGQFDIVLTPMLNYARNFTNVFNNRCPLIKVNIINYKHFVISLIAVILSLIVYIYIL